MMEHLNMNKLLNLKRDIRFEAKGENEYKLTVYGSIGGWFSENNAEAVRRKIQDVKAEKFTFILIRVEVPHLMV